MTRPVLLAAALLLLLAMLAASATVLLTEQARQRHFAARLRSVRPGGADGLPAAPGARDAAGLVRALGGLVVGSGLLSRRTVEELQHTLTVAGLRGPGALAMFVGSKLLLMLLLPLAMLLLLRPLDLAPLLHNLAVGAAGIVGLLGPGWWVARRRAGYLRAVASGLPDALDMMVICAEAGLGLEPSLARVAREIGHAHPAIAAELTQTVSELRLSADTAAALGGIGTRTGLEGLKRVASVLAQTLRYGTPLGQALRVLSAEMRQETMVRFEARAARLPVLLTLPMIAFILPCLFLIVGGPAIVQTLHAMHH